MNRRSCDLGWRVRGVATRLVPKITLGNLVLIILGCRTIGQSIYLSTLDNVEEQELICRVQSASKDGSASTAAACATVRPARRRAIQSQVRAGVVSAGQVRAATGRATDTATDTTARCAASAASTHWPATRRPAAAAVCLAGTDPAASTVSISHIRRDMIETYRLLSDWSI